LKLGISVQTASKPAALWRYGVEHIVKNISVSTKYLQKEKQKEERRSIAKLYLKIGNVKKYFKCNAVDPDNITDS